MENLYILDDNVNEYNDYKKVIFEYLQESKIKTTIQPSNRKFVSKNPDKYAKSGQ